MGEFLKNINWKHVLIMCIGNVFAGMGIGIFKLAGLGTDPFSGMNMAVADMIVQWRKKQDLLFLGSSQMIL